MPDILIPSLGGAPTGAVSEEGFEVANHYSALPFLRTGIEGSQPQGLDVCIDIDKDAFAGLATSLARSHASELVGTARREGLLPEDALDAVQEAFHTFLRMPQARSLLEEPDEARALLRVLVRNVARNLRRRHHRSQTHEALASGDELEANALPVDVLIEKAERHVQLAGCMRRLDDVQRSIVTLRVLEETSGVEVARTLDLTPGHVAVLLHRAKQNLMRCMLEE